MTRRTRTAAAAAALMLALGLAAPARAQVFTGRIDVSIEDSAGARVAGAKVEVAGPIGQAQTSDAHGEAHFADLPVGIYGLTVTMKGVPPSTTSDVSVLSGERTRVVVSMGAAGATETATRAALAPTIGPTPGVMTTHLSADDLQETPNARDPWAMLQTVPTVYLDRVNIGGSESGQQSNYNAKGAQASDNTWNLDGVPVTDAGDSAVVRPESTGASALYFDLDSVQEMAVTTGGADVQRSTAGVQVDMVLKKGFSSPHADSRFYFSDDKLQDVNFPQSLSDALGDVTGKGNRTDKYQDYGFDLGGPLLQDVVWVWGTMARTAIDLITLTGTADSTQFSNNAFKADAKLNDAVRGSFTFYENNKTRDGRGASPTRLPETTWDQTGPSKYYKGEGNFVLRENVFISARGAYIDSGFLLTPVGGLTTNYYVDDSGVAHNTYFQYQSAKPQHFGAGDVTYFHGIHQVKAGGSWRRSAVDTQQTWPGSHVVSIWNGYPNMLAQVSRDYQSNTVAEYLSGYVSDTVSRGRVTLTGGVRYDRQTSSVAPSSVAAVSGFEMLLPAVSSPAIDDVFVWTKLTPRVGVTVALDEARRTIVRGSYAMFASQLPAAQAAFVSPVQYAYATYNAIDKNGDGVAQLSEILTAQGLQGATGFDPKNPSAAINRVAAGTTPPITHELVAGVDRELTPRFSVSGSVTYRRMQDLSWTPLVGVTQANYTRAGILTGTAAEIGSYSVPLYALSAAALPPGGGEVFTVRDGYHQRYVGLEVGATKRLSNRWAARVGLSTNSWREYFDDPSKAILDPTPAPSPSMAFPFAGAQVDGGPVARAATSSGGNGVYMVAPAYQISANGLYQVYWGVSVAASVISRQGYAEPFFQSNVATGDPLGRKTVLIAPAVDAFRLPAVTSLDGRVEKTFMFGSAKLAIDIDLFNVLNSATVLSRQYDARLTGATGFGQTLEIMNPRVARLGVRFVF
ncbi:MAG TPA: TonB-dependent receptor [Vicinamibacterales bacterium]|nr:TonB-dependent receptor [Vicinamibacterales bacterium]